MMRDDLGRRIIHFAETFILKYEFETYRELNSNVPKQGAEVWAGDKKLFVLTYNTLEESLILKHRESDRGVKIMKSELDYNNNRYTVKREVVERLKEDDE